MKRIAPALALLAAAALAGCATTPSQYANLPPEPPGWIRALEALLVGPDTTTTTVWTGNRPTRVSVHQPANSRRSSVTIH